MKQKNKNLFLIILIIITSCAIILTAKYKNPKKINNEEKKELKTFDEISNVYLNDSIFIGQNYNEGYYLMDFDNNIIDKSSNIINYLLYGYYYKDDVLNNFKKPIEKVENDDLVNIYFYGTIPNYFFEPLNNVNSFYNEDLNIFVAYKYFNDETQIATYNLKTGELINSKIFSGEIDCSNKEYFKLISSPNSIIDIKTLNLVVPEDYTITFSNKDFYIVSNNNKYGVLNYKGDIIIPIEYESIETDKFSKLFIGKKNNKLGILNLKNEIILEFNDYENVVIYNDYIIYLIDNEITVKKDDFEILTYNSNLNFNVKEVYNNYFLLEIVNDCLSCQLNKIFLINNKNYISLKSNIVSIIENKLKKNGLYIIVSEEFNNSIYNEELNLLFLTQSYHFNKATHFNDDFIMLDNDAFIDLRKHVVVHDISTKNRILYSINEPLNNKFIIKFNNNYLNIYNLENKLIKRIKGVKNIIYLNNDYFMFEKTNNKFLIMKLDI